MTYLIEELDLFRKHRRELGETDISHIEDDSEIENLLLETYKIYMRLEREASQMDMFEGEFTQCN